MPKERIMPLVIGITGSIASGKSTACKYLVGGGAAYCDADKLVHRMYDPGKPAFARIIEAFGPEIVGKDGYIDRKLLGAKVFGKPKAMLTLTTAIGDIQAEVRKVIDSWRRNLQDNEIALLEAVNFIEAGYGRFSDFTWLFAVNDDIAIERLKFRNDLSTQAAKQRLASQRSWIDREPAADLVTHNNGSNDAFIKSVDKEMSKIHSQWLKGTLSVSRYHAWWKIQSSEPV